MFGIIFALQILFTIGIVIIMITTITSIARPSSKKTNKFSRGLPFAIIILLVIGVLFSSGSFIPLSLINVFILMIITFFSIICLNRIYTHITNNSPHVLQTIVYLFSLLSVGGAGLGSAFSINNYDLNIEGAIELAAASISLLVGSTVILFLLERVVGNNTNALSRKTFVNPTKDKMQHYRDTGLTDEEISYLRDQLAQLRDHIITLDKQMNATAKLRAIDVRHNTIQISQQFFQDIVKEPKRFGEAGDAIYRIIPSLDDLTEKYNEVSEHIAKNKQTYLILEKSAQTIDELAERLTEEYIRFHKATYQDLDDEINLANRNLNRKQTFGSSDSVDDILNEWNNDDNPDNTDPKE